MSPTADNDFCHFKVLSCKFGGLQTVPPPLFADACHSIVHESFPQNHGGDTANKILLGSVDLSVCLSTYLFSLFFPLPSHSSVKQKNITTIDCRDVPNQGISWNSREMA